MPARDKKAINLANMTDEERLMYEVEQRIAEREAKKKQEIIMNKYLETKLLNEASMSKINFIKVNETWRRIMRELKSKEQRLSLEKWSQGFEEVIVRKDNLVKEVLEDLSNIEEQYLVAMRIHSTRLDSLIETHRDRLKVLKSDYDNEISVIKEEFDTEMQLMIAQHRQEMCDLKEIIVAFDIDHSNKEIEAHWDFCNIRDEMKNKNIEDKHALKIELEAKVNELWSNTTSTNTKYENVSTDRRNQFEKLKIKDERSTTDIRMYSRKLQNVADKINDIKMKMTNFATGNDDSCEQIRTETDKVVLQFQNIRAYMNRYRATQREKLTKMSLEADNAKQKVKKLVEKAETILRLGEMCRKYETEEEKVLPFYKSSLTANEAARVNAAILNTRGDETIMKIVKSYQDMDNFWRRFNKVKLDRFAAVKERNLLTEENNWLRNILKQYLDGISVNAEILERLNPLFVVNGRTNMNPANEDLDTQLKPVPNVRLEAAHIVKHGVTSQLIKGREQHQ